MNRATGRGLVLAAPSSGSGKTVITIGLVAALRRRGLGVAAAKTGPDYLDTAFLSEAAGAPAVNLDPWAMRPALVASLAHEAGARADLLVIEGVMGLFDGAAGGRGSTADLARALALPAILVIDAARQAQSAAAVAQGFRLFDPSVNVAGVILNRVAGARHERLLREALGAKGIAVLGAIPRMAGLELPSRHLGLVQACETADLGTIVAQAGEAVERHTDVDAIADWAAPVASSAGVAGATPPAQRIALARDEAFAFTYRHIEDGWRKAGAEVTAFSPLADEAPDARAGAVVLPGGYPEHHAGRLAGNHRFLAGLRDAAQRGAIIQGECGGYMVLGRGLVDADGMRHAMAGLLGLETSFAARRLSLGYRRMRVLHDAGTSAIGSYLRGHEFHYATVTREEGEPLFEMTDSEGNALGVTGLVDGRVSGSFVHVVDRE